MIADLEAAPSQTVTLRSRDNQHLEGWDLLGRSFDRVVMVAQTMTQDAGDPGGSNPALASSGHVTARSMSLRSPMLTFATKKLSTGADGQKEDAASAQF